MKGPRGGGGGGSANAGLCLAWSLAGPEDERLCGRNICLEKTSTRDCDLARTTLLVYSVFQKKKLDFEQRFNIVDFEDSFYIV